MDRGLHWPPGRAEPRTTRTDVRQASRKPTRAAPDVAGPWQHGHRSPGLTSGAMGVSVSGDCVRGEALLEIKLYLLYFFFFSEIGYGPCHNVMNAMGRLGGKSGLWAPAGLAQSLGHLPMD